MKGISAILDGECIQNLLDNTEKIVLGRSRAVAPRQVLPRLLTGAPTSEMTI